MINQIQGETKIMYAHGSLDKIFSALAKAKLDFYAVEKTQSGHYGDYADLSDINDATQEALSSQGIIATQAVSKGLVITTLGHESGQHIVYETHFRQEDGLKALAIGALWTLMRRYALMAALNVSGSDDAEDKNNISFTPDFDIDDKFTEDKLIESAKKILKESKTFTKLSEYKEWFGKQAIPLQKIKKECKDSHSYLMSNLAKTNKELGDKK